eukprot:Rhum_TRINITY_DN14794_c0_g1::Rhum_TRINITY_DN14794_c0_g1_i1::g.116520::m.116520
MRRRKTLHPVAAEAFFQQRCPLTLLDRPVLCLRLLLCGPRQVQGTVGARGTRRVCVYLRHDRRLPRKGDDVTFLVVVGRQRTLRRPVVRPLQQRSTLVHKRRQGRNPQVHEQRRCGIQRRAHQARRKVVAAGHVDEHTSERRADQRPGTEPEVDDGEDCSELGSGKVVCRQGWVAREAACDEEPHQAREDQQRPVPGAERPHRHQRAAHQMSDLEGVQVSPTLARAAPHDVADGLRETEDAEKQCCLGVVDRRAMLVWLLRSERLGVRVRVDHNDEEAVRKEQTHKEQHDHDAVCENLLDLQVRRRLTGRLVRHTFPSREPRQHRRHTQDGHVAERHAPPEVLQQKVRKQRTHSGAKPAPSVHHAERKRTLCAEPLADGRQAR